MFDDCSLSKIKIGVTLVRYAGKGCSIKVLSVSNSVSVTVSSNCPSSFELWRTTVREPHVTERIGYRGGMVGGMDESP